MKTNRMMAALGCLIASAAHAQDTSREAPEEARPSEEAPQEATPTAPPAPTAAEVEALRQQLAASQALLERMVQAQQAPSPPPAAPVAPYGYSPGIQDQLAQREAYMLWRSLPDKLPYRASEGIPSGYEKVTRVRTGALAAGGSMLGIGWMGSTIAAAADQQVDGVKTLTPLYVPVLGPWIAMGLDGAQGDLTPLGGWALAFDGVVQAAGLGLLVWGGVDKRELLKKQAFGVTSVTPTVRPDGAGVGVNGQF